MKKHSFFIAVLLTIGLQTISAADSHFKLMGSWSGWNSGSLADEWQINKSYEQGRSKYYIEVQVTEGQDYYFALYNGWNRFAPKTGSTEVENVTIDITNLATFGSVEVEKGNKAGAAYNEEIPGENVSNHSWKLTANYTGALRICIDEDGEGQEWYPYMWLERPTPKNITIYTYVDPAVANWTGMYYFTQNVLGNSTYQNSFTPNLEKGDDGWYSYTYENVERIKWVATASNENWNVQVNDIDEIRGDKYYYIAPDKHDNGHYKVVELNNKPTAITFSVLPTDMAKETWGTDLTFRYWSKFAFVGEDATDHPYEVAMTEQNGVYSCSFLPFAPIKFWIQNNGHQSQSMTNNEEGYTESTCFSLYNEKVGDNYKCEVNNGCTFPTYSVNLIADKTSGEAGLQVTFTPSISPEVAAGYKYFINGAETALTDNQYTFDEIGYYKVKVQYTVGENYFESEEVIIQVTKDVNFKVHLTGAAKEEFGMDVYFRYWMWYDGYDHAAIVKMTETQDGDWYEATIPALNNVKFLLKNTDGAEYLDNTKQTIDMTNSEAGFIEDACFEMTNEKVEEKFKCNDLPTCEYTSYEVTLTVDKDVCKEGETFTFTPGITGYKESVTFSYTINGDAAELPDNQFTPAQFGEYTVKVSTIIQGEVYYATKIVKCTRDITLYVYFEQCAKDKWGADNLYMHYWMNYGGYDHATDVKMAATDKADWYKTEIATAYPVKFLLCDNATCDLSGEHTANVEGKDNAGYTNDAYFLLDRNDGNKVTPVEASALEATPVTMTIYYTSQAEETWGDQAKWMRYWMYITNAETKESGDHTSYVELKEQSKGVYTASMLAIGGIKFTIQSCDFGYQAGCGDGSHYTANQMTNNDAGYTENRAFRVVDNNAGGHVLEEYVENKLKIHFTTDGFSTVCWDRTWSVTEEEALVYVGTYNEENSTLDLERVVDGIVPAEAGVVLYSQSMAGKDATIYPSDQTPSNYYSLTNSLKGTLVATNRNTDVTTYVLAYTTDEPQTMLHQYTGAAIPANKAYLEIGGSASAPARIRMVMPKQQPTDLMEQQMNMPVRKIMKGGHLYIIKYGQHFTLQGQEVK